MFGPAGAIAIDSGEGAFGRGAYVHPTVDCVRIGGARGLARRRPNREEGGPRPLEGLHIDGAPLGSETLRAAVVDAYARRLGGLFAAARRSRAVVHGADACCAAIATGDAAVVVVATDAAAAAERTEVRAAIAAGRAVAWGTKRALGDLADAGREDGIAVVAILDPRIGLAATEAFRVMDTLRVAFTDPTLTRSGGARSEGARSEDVQAERTGASDGNGTARSGLVERRA